MKQFNEDMEELLAGKRVELPVYNFVKGEREYKGDFLQLGAEDILVIEGIHCLNDDLSYSLPRDKKFKIYISALTQLNIDDHNRSSDDGRTSDPADGPGCENARCVGTGHDPDVGFRPPGRGAEYFPVSGRGGCDVQLCVYYMSFRCSNSMRSRSVYQCSA